MKVIELIEHIRQRNLDDHGLKRYCRRDCNNALMINIVDSETNPIYQKHKRKKKVKVVLLDIQDMLLMKSKHYTTTERNK